MKLVVNEKEVDVTPPDDMPLLWVLRDLLGYTGTKFGCGVSQCGACTVHLDGKAVRSCITPAAAVGARKVTTIEGLSPDATHPVQRAWAEVDVVQCGYCQSGQIMAAAALLAQNPNPWPKTRTQPTPTSTRPWPETSAAAGPTSASARRSTAPPL